MVSQSKACENFLEKRKKLMQQFYIENEYKKRNFLLKNEINKYIDVIESEYIHIHILNDINRLEELDICLISHFANKEYDNLSFVNKEMSKEIINAEIMSRKEYGLPFYVLAHPNCIYDILKENNYKNSLNPAIPYFTNNDKFIYNSFFNAVFSYECTDFEENRFLQFEKDALICEYKKTLDGKRKPEDVSLLTAIVACRNGYDLNDSEFNELSRKIDEILIDNTRINSLKSRLEGLLYFDFEFALRSEEKKCKTNEFINTFSDILGLEKKSFYTESVKKTYKDSLRNAQHCIAKGKMLKINNKRKLLKFPKIDLPEYLPWYGDMAQEYMKKK